MEKKEGDLSHSYRGFCMGRASEIGKWVRTCEENTPVWLQYGRQGDGWEIALYNAIRFFYSLFRSRSCILAATRSLQEFREGEILLIDVLVHEKRLLIERKKGLVQTISTKKANTEKRRWSRHLQGDLLGVSHTYGQHSMGTVLQVSFCRWFRESIYLSEEHLTARRKRQHTVLYPMLWLRTLLMCDTDFQNFQARSQEPCSLQGK